MNSASCSTLVVDRKWVELFSSRSVPELLAEYKRVEAIVCDLDFLRCRGLLQILYKLDFLLAEGGRWEVRCVSFLPLHGCGHRSYNQMQYAFSNTFKERYLLVSRENGVLTFVKQKNRRLSNLKISAVTFGFISDGSQVGQLDLIFEQLYNQALVDVEVLLCGPVERHEQLRVKYPRLVLLPDYQHKDIRPPINIKKKMIIDSAKFENLVLSHDRFFFDKNWFERFVEYGNAFDFYNCRRCDWSAYPNEIRVHGDWSGMLWPATAYGYAPTSYSVDYGNPNPNIYINGGLYVGKTELFRHIAWPTHLNWGDMEDVHFTRLVELSGSVIQMDLSNRVFTTTKRLARVPKASFLSKAKGLFFTELRRIIFKIRHGVEFVD